MFGICYMLNVCVCWPVIINGFGLLYVKCLCVWPVIINAFGICYVKCLCVLASDH